MLGKRTLTLALFVAAPLGSGCSGTDGTIGDPPSHKIPSELGNGTPLSELIGPALWLNTADTTNQNCAWPPDANVFVSGLTINAIDKFDETGSGAVGNFYVQDSSESPRPYSGVNVFAPSFSPPDLRLAEGDIADLLGVYSEFRGPQSFPFPGCRTLPEIRGTMSFRFENGPRKPKTIPLADLQNYSTARRWLGMLVRVEGVTITGTSTSKGRYAAEIEVGGGGSQGDGPTITNELYDVAGDGPPMPDGASFKAVTGIVTFFAQFHVAPRSSADFEK